MSLTATLHDEPAALVADYEARARRIDTPCRGGTEKAVDLLRQPKWDTALLEELSQTMADASICGLGQAAPNPIRSVVKHFADEI